MPFTCISTPLTPLTLLSHSWSFTFKKNSRSKIPPHTLLFHYLHFLFLIDAPVGLVLLFPPPTSALPCLFLLCLCIYAHRSWPKVNRQCTIAHSTGSTVIQPSGQDLSQTGNNMLNHWVLLDTAPQTANAGQSLITYPMYLYAVHVYAHVLGEY